MILTTTWTQITTIAGLGASVQKNSLDDLLVKYSALAPTDLDNSFVIRDYVKHDFYNGEAGDYLWARAADDEVEVAYEQLDISGDGGGGGGSMTNLEVKLAYEANSNTNAFTDAEKTKLTGVEANATEDQTGSEIKALYEAESNTNAFTNVEQSKLANIEANATADQTDLEIKTAYEANADTNAYTDAEKTKLANLQADATDDQTGAEIKALYEAEADTNAFTNAEKTKLSGIEANATGDQTNAEIKIAYEANADTNVFTNAEKSKLGTVESNATADQTGAEIKAAYEAEANTNAFTDAEKSKLFGVQANATDDQTGAEIKAAYEGELDTNAYTDAEKTKLSGIESSATGDQTDVEIKTAYEANADTNAFTDAEKSKLSGLSDPLFLGVYTSQALLDAAHPTPVVGSHAYIDAGVGNDAELAIWDDTDDQFIIQAGGGSETSATIKSKYEANADTNAYTDVEKSKLANIELNATADQTGAEIKIAYEAEADTNAYTDAEKLKLQNIESNATDDQTGAEIKAAYEAEPDTNAYTDAEKTKLSGIEVGADVTDTANVTASGALMDSELTNIAAIKGLDQAVNTDSDVTFRSIDVNNTGSTNGIDITQSGSGTSLNINNSGSGDFIVVDSDKLVLDNAGNLGIGIDPVSKLHVAGETRIYPTAGDAVLRFGENGVEKGKVAASTTGEVYIEAGGSEKARLNSFGLGVNGTPIQNGLGVFNTGGGQLRVYRDDSTILNNEELGSIHFQGTQGLGLAGAAIRAEADENWVAGSNAGGKLVLRTTTNGATTPTDKMCIDNAGNVGIGQDVPEGKLHVESDGTTNAIIESTGSGASDYAQITVKSNAGGLGAIWKNPTAQTGYGGSGSMNIGTFGAENLSLVTNNEARLTINSGGNVGVGTGVGVTPARKFHVDTTDSVSARFETDSVFGSGFELHSSDGPTNNWSIYASATSNAGGSGSLVFNDQSGGGERFRVDGNGNFGIGINVPNAKLHVAEDSLAFRMTAKTSTSSIYTQTSNGTGSLLAGVDGSLGNLVSGSTPYASIIGTNASGVNTHIISSGTVRLTVKPDGIINIANAPTYADDTAAGVGGLVVGDVYKTAAGDLKIKL